MIRILIGQLIFALGVIGATNFNAQPEETRFSFSNWDWKMPVLRSAKVSFKTK